MKTISKSIYFALPFGNGAIGSGSSFRVYAKKKKQSKSRSREGPELTPLRITTNVKQNLQSLRSWKEYQRTNTPKPATSYRRKKVEKKDLPDEDTEDTDVPEDIPLGTFYRRREVTGDGIPVLLVDGYNVCNCWPKLKKHISGGRLDLARETLINELRSFGGAKVVVVFDAMYSGRPTTKEKIFGCNVEVVFSAHTSADAWIENEVVALLKGGCPRVCVATNDNWVQEEAFEAGAFVWSSEKLVSKIDGTDDDLGDGKTSVYMEGRLLKFDLDPKVVDALLDLRDKLYETELLSKKKGSVKGKFMEYNLDSEVATSLKDVRNKLPEAQLLGKKKEDDVVYSTDNSADAWIENEVAELEEDGCPRLSVAINGHWERQAAFDEIEATEEEIEGTEETSTSTQGRWLLNPNSGVGNAVKNLRDKLYETDPRTKRLEQRKLMMHNLDPEVADSRDKLPKTETLGKKKESTSTHGGLLKHDPNSEVADAHKDPRNKLSGTEFLSKTKGFRPIRRRPVDSNLDSLPDDCLTELKKKPPPPNRRKSRYG